MKDISRLSLKERKWKSKSKSESKSERKSESKSECKSKSMSNCATISKKKRIRISVRVI